MNKLGEKRGESKCALVFGQMNEPPGARARVALTGLAIAEHFRDHEGQDVLLFVDNIFRFTQARRKLPLHSTESDTPMPERSARCDVMTLVCLRPAMRCCPATTSLATCKRAADPARRHPSLFRVTDARAAHWVHAWQSNARQLGGQWRWRAHAGLPLGALAPLTSWRPEAAPVNPCSLVCLLAQRRLEAHTLRRAALQTGTSLVAKRVHGGGGERGSHGGERQQRIGRRARTGVGA